jgi:hypothetical protein
MQRVSELGHTLPRPQLGEQLILGHYAVTMLDEVGEDLERFRFELDGHASAAQLAERFVKFAVAEDVDHRPYSRWSCPVCRTKAISHLARD